MINDFRKAAAGVIPTERQMKFMSDPFYAFVHFSPNTYTGKEWGDGSEDPAIFNPAELDCDEWVSAIKSAGMTGMVLTAKHHDGFCLWPSKYTEHSVKNSPWKNGKGDVVREAAEACRRGGIRFGFYLSPWDRNSKLYGTDAYNDYYKKQLTELLTEYGEIFYVWFDGACGEGPNGKKQEYDFPGYIELIRKYQPNACIFNDGGPDIRWIGNESGKARYAEWCVLPIELIHRCEMQKELTPEGNLEDIYNTWQDLGSDAILRHSRGLSFCPAETDMSIRNGWFYHPEEAPHSLERLLNTYYTSVGGNASFNLNIPPMPNGKFDPRDVKRLKEMGDALRSAFEKDITNEAVIEKIESSSSQAQYRAAFNEKKDVRMVVLKENISCGQRVERFQLLKKDDFGKKKCFYEGTTIGFQKICPVREEGITEFFIKILSSRDEADVDIRIFG